jgi:hypothetical protein
MYIGYILAFIATLGTYASFSAAGFGALAVLPAFLVMIIVLTPFARKQT